MRTIVPSGIALAVAALGLPTPAAAVTTTLDFGDGLCSLAATAQCGSGSSAYGQSYGDSPIVNVFYRVGTAPPAASFQITRGRYGEVVTMQRDRGAITGRFSEITIIPAAGYEVSLIGFDGACSWTTGGCSALPYQLAAGDITLASGQIATPPGGGRSLTLNSAYRPGAIVLRWAPGGEVEGLDNIVFDVRRDAAAGVPEPASWAMMIGGFALAGGAARRRRSALAIA